ncbi:hypothetical protein BROC_00925 [Candidatus Brocadiaceae bacterium]|nr:hypothetical protein BROC_00925 [Candidatus Brocadiaceae bacterium]
MDIDNATLRDAENKFESKNRGSRLSDLGLSKSARRKLIRYGMAPGKITDVNEIQEYLYISLEYKKILNNVMKVHPPKRLPPISCANSNKSKKRRKIMPIKR